MRPVPLAAARGGWAHHVPAYSPPQGRTASPAAAGRASPPLSCPGSAGAGRVGPGARTWSWAADACERRLRADGDCYAAPCSPSRYTFWEPSPTMPPSPSVRARMRARRGHVSQAQPAARSTRSSHLTAWGGCPRQLAVHGRHHGGALVVGFVDARRGRLQRMAGVSGATRAARRGTASRRRRTASASPPRRVAVRTVWRLEPREAGPESAEAASFSAASVSASSRWILIRFSWRRRSRSSSWARLLGRWATLLRAVCAREAGVPTRPVGGLPEGERCPLRESPSTLRPWLLSGAAMGSGVGVRDAVDECSPPVFQVPPPLAPALPAGPGKPHRAWQVSSRRDVLQRALVHDLHLLREGRGAAVAGLAEGD